MPRGGGAASSSSSSSSSNSSSSSSSSGGDGGGGGGGGSSSSSSRAAGVMKLCERAALAALVTHSCQTHSWELPSNAAVPELTNCKLLATRRIL